MSSAESDDGETNAEVVCCSLAVVAKCVDVLKRYLSRQAHISLVLINWMLLLGAPVAPECFPSITQLL